MCFFNNFLPPTAIVDFCSTVCSLIVQRKERNKTPPKKLRQYHSVRKMRGCPKPHENTTKQKKKKMTFPRSMEATTRNQQQQKKTQQGKERHYRAFDSAAAHSQNRHFFFFIGAFQIPSCHTFFFLRGKKTRSSHLFKNTLCW